MSFRNFIYHYNENVPVIAKYGSTCLKSYCISVNKVKLLCHIFNM